MIYNKPFFFYTTERKKIKKQSFRFERNKNDKYKTQQSSLTRKLASNEAFVFEEIFQFYILLILWHLKRIICLNDMLENNNEGLDCFLK